MLSLIFATYNGAKTLPLMMESLTRLNAPPGGWKVIAIDNASTDETANILQGYLELLPLTVLYEPKQGKNNALNQAIPYSKGELLVFTDDDIVADENWLEELTLAASRYPQFDVFAGQVRHYWITSPPAWLLRLAAQGNAYGGTPVDMSVGPIEWSGIKGANFMVRQAAVDPIRFSSSIGPDGSKHYISGSEAEFLKRLGEDGLKMLYCPSAKVQHIVRSDQNKISSILLRYYRIGKGIEKLTPTIYEGHIKTIFGYPRFSVRYVFENSISTLKYLIMGRSYEAVCIMMDIATTIGRIHEWRKRKL